MNESGAAKLDPAAAFAEHVRGFHAGLPAEEQALLEQIFALAAAAGQAGVEVSGYVYTPVSGGLTTSPVPIPYPNINALITEIGLPALDAAGKDASKLTIKFSPEYTTRQFKSP